MRPAMWILALRTGDFIDKEGNPRSFTRSDLERIARAYDPRWHEAPLVADNPKGDAPAYGWVETLQPDGDELLAKVNLTVPEFAKTLREGLYRKKSISLYPDGSLRYLGVVGATAPSIPGLSTAKFKEKPFTVIEFQEEEFMGTEFEIRIERHRRLGESLHEKVIELLNGGRKFDQLGNPIPANLTYSEALRIICRENTSEALEYMESLGPRRRT
jgi:hypothetical protein